MCPSRRRDRWRLNVSSKITCLPRRKTDLPERTDRRKDRAGSRGSRQETVRGVRNVPALADAVRETDPRVREGKEDRRVQAADPVALEAAMPVEIVLPMEEEAQAAEALSVTALRSRVQVKDLHQTLL